MRGKSFILLLRGAAHVPGHRVPYCPMLRHFLAVSILAACFLAMGPTSAPARHDAADLPAELRESVMQRQIELTTEEDGATSCVLRVVNGNGPAGDGFEPQAHRILLLPEKGFPTITPIEANYRLIGQDGNHYRYRQGDPAPAGLTAPRDLGYFVTIEDLGRFRGWRLGKLKIKVSRSVMLGALLSGRQELLDARFALEYPSGAGLDHTWPTAWSDAAGDAFLRALVVNPAMPRRLVAPTQPPSFAEVEKWVALLDRGMAAGPVLRLHVYRPGLYRFTSRMIGEAGIENPLQYAPGDFRLYRSGREVPLLVGTGEATMGPEGDSYFYAPPSELRQEFYHEVYWLALKGRELAATPPARFDRDAGKLADAPEATELPRVRWSQEWYRKEGYERNLSPALGFSRWYWKSVPAGQVRDFEFEIRPLAPAGSEASLRIDVAVPLRRTSPQLIAWLNGKRLGAFTFAGSENEQISFAVPAEALRPGMNKLSIGHEGSNPTRSPDSLHIKGFRLDMPSTMAGSAPGFEVSLDWPEGATEAPALLPFTIGDSLPNYIVDVTLPESPRLLGRGARGPGLPQGIILGGTMPRRLAIHSTESAFLPGGMEVAQSPKCLLPGDGAASLVIHHRDFAEGAARLAGWHRERDGMSARTVDVQELYDAFDYGRPTHRAIHRALQYAASYWAHPRPFYVTLIGESSEYRGDPAELPQQTMRDFVPIYDIDETHRNILRGDARYAMLTANGTLPELAISRLSVATMIELDGQLNKLERYVRAAHTGDWMLKHVFVTDDDSEFGVAARRIVAATMSDEGRGVAVDQADFPFANYDRVPEAKHSNQATKRLLDEFNDGAMLVNYFGHGGPNIWSHERLLHIEDLKQLKNAGREAMVTCSSCDNAWLDYPVPPVSSSMGEILAKMPEGGAIAVFAPTAAGMTREHRLLIEKLYDAILHRGLTRPGDATLFAKLTFFAETGAPDLPDQFVLLGDPALRLRVPRAKAGLTVEPAFIDTARGGDVSIRARLDAPIWGWARVSVKSDVTGAEVATAVFRARSGAFQGTIPIAAGSPSATYTISAFIYNDKRSESRLLTGKLIAGRPSLEWAFPTRLLSVTASNGYGDTGFPIEILNTSATAIEGAEVIVRRLGTEAPVFQRRISLGVDESREQTFRYPAAPGVYSLEVELRPTPDATTWRTYPVTAVVYSPDGPEDLRIETARPAPVEVLPQAGQRLSLPVRVFNTGGAAAAGAPTLVALLRNSLSGEALTLNESFTRPAPGRYGDVRMTTTGTLERVAMPINFVLATQALEDAPSIETMSEPLNLNWREGVDLAVVPDSLRFISEGFMNGETVFAEATVRNDGGIPSGEFRVGLFSEVPWVRENLLDAAQGQRGKLEPTLAPGESRTVRTRWDGVQTRGIHNIYFVVNVDKRIAETSLTNNLTMAQLRVNPHPDLVWIGPLTVTPASPERGDQVMLTGTLHNDGKLPMSGVNVTAKLISGLAAGTVEASGSIQVDLDPGERREIVMPLQAPTFANKAVLEANGDKRVPELDFGNNTAEADIWMPVQASELVAEGDGKRLSYTGVLARGVARDLFIRPDGSLFPTPSVLATTVFQRIEKDYAKRLSAPDNRQLDASRDNAWTVESGILEAHPGENAEPLRLAVPAGTGRKGLHMVRVRTRNERDYQGFPASAFRLRAEQEMDYRDYTLVPTEDRESSVKTSDLGVFDLVDGVFDVIVDDPADTSVWSTIFGFEFTPVTGDYTAPALDLSSLRARYASSSTWGLHAEASMPDGSELRAWWRIAKRDADGALSWGEWQAIEGILADDGAPLPFGDASLLQWRLEAAYVPGSPPEIRNLSLVPRRVP